jgi:serine/threonine protein kinase/ligand-binding sensor domain-containing protein
MHEHIGRTLGSYQIVEQIGQGGMATVYMAYQPSMDRYVAIKILPSHFTEDESFLGRFTQEARTLARLEHPHILPVHDYGEQDGITYLAMRYVGAGTLKDLIAQEGAQELAEATRILAQMGSALDYAHSQGVVHRDVKPSNVLIDQQRNTFLTDFGIAKLVAESAQFTASGAIIGTPAYMSPEQGMGEPADHRSDIYSLGVVLFELVTGRAPFEAETPLAVLLKHINDPLPPPRQINPDLPEQVQRVILKATAKAPDDRYQSAQDMIDALALAVTAEPTDTIPPPSSDKALTAAILTNGAGEPAAPAAVITQPVAQDTAYTSPAAVVEPPELATSGPVQDRKPWFFLAGGALLVGLLLIAGLVNFPNLSGGESTPSAAAREEALPTSESQPERIPPTDVPAQVQRTPGWTNYRNGNFISTLARQENALWAGGESGLVRWDVTDGSHTRFDRTHELASSRVNDLLVDDAGVLWIATDAGINSYDGETLTAFSEVDGLDAKWIQTLFLDEAGGLWAGSRGGERGLNFFDGEGWGPPPVPPLPVGYPNVQVLAGNDERGLFVGLEEGGLAHIDGKEWLVLTRADGLPGDELLDALLTDDALWVSFYQGVVRIDMETGDLETFPQDGIQTMHQTADGKIWFGGIWRVVSYDPVSGDWQEYGTDSGSIPASLVTDSVADENGSWFGSYGGGAFYFDGSDWQTLILDEELGGNLIEAIRQDPEGGVWFSHPGSGLSRYDPDEDTWQVFGEAENALDWPSVPAVDGDGSVWCGDYGQLVRYDGQSWQSVKPPELTNLEIYAVEIGPKDVQWLVTDKGLMRHDPATDDWTMFTSADHPIIQEIWSILAASDGTVWLGGEDGLVRYDGTSWDLPTAAGDAPRYVDDIAEAPDGSIWIAADGKLGNLVDGEWVYHTWPTDSWLETLTVAPDGSVWAGYEGLGHFDPSSGDWRLFTPSDGLAHLHVRAIHVTPEGVVWVGTEGGVSRYVPSD